MNDGQADSAAATVSIAVQAVNDRPSAAGESYTVQGGSTLTVAAPGVLGNDTDIDSGRSWRNSGVEPPRRADPERQRLVHLHAGGGLLGTGRLLVSRQRRARGVHRRDRQPDHHAGAGRHDRTVVAIDRLRLRRTVSGTVTVGHGDRCRRRGRRPVPSQRLAARSRRYGVALQPRVELGERGQWRPIYLLRARPETPRATSRRPRPYRSPSTTSPSPASWPPTASTKVSGTTLVDRSGRGHTGTISGATWSTQGKFGGALSFDGVNDWVTIGDTAALDLTTGMTLEAWVAPSTLSGWRTALLKERPGGLAYALYTSGDDTRPSGYVAAPGDVAVIGSASLPVNTWTHVALTYDGANLRLFVNGVQVRTTALSSAITTSTGVLRIGGNSVWSEFFQGRIDDVRIYNRALTAGEIQADMAAPITP